MLKGNAFKTMLTCCLYHFYLGVVCSMEVSYYKLVENGCLQEKFLRYCFYFVFVFYTSIHITTKPKYLNCIFSLTTSLVIIPLGFYEILFSAHNPIKNDIILCYIIRCIMNMIIGYPHFFTFLEEWLHYIATSFFTIYFLWRDNMVFFFFGLTLETSIVFINLYCLFPTNNFQK